MVVGPISHWCMCGGVSSDVENYLENQNEANDINPLSLLCFDYTLKAYCVPSGGFSLSCPNSPLLMISISS